MGLGPLIFIIVLFALMWLVLIRPQRRRQLEQAQLIERLEVGDEIVTAGGLYGRLTRIDADEVGVEVAPGVEVRVARQAVAAVRPERARAAGDGPSGEIRG